MVHIAAKRSEPSIQKKAEMDPALLTLLSGSSFQVEDYIANNVNTPEEMKEFVIKLAKLLSALAHRIYD